MQGAAFFQHRPRPLPVYSPRIPGLYRWNLPGSFPLTLPDAYRDLPLLDFGDQLILPGLVDLHLHGPQFAYRGLGMDLELLDWSHTHTFPEEAKFQDLAYAEPAYRQFTHALKHSFTTRAAIFATAHTEATPLLMDLLDESGLITYVGRVNMDRDCPEPLRESDPKAALEETRRWLDAVQGRYHRTRPILTPPASSPPAPPPSWRAWGSWPGKRNFRCRAICRRIQRRLPWYRSAFQTPVAMPRSTTGSAS